MCSRALLCVFTVWLTSEKPSTGPLLIKRVPTTSGGPMKAGSHIQDQAWWVESVYHLSPYIYSNDGVAQPQLSLYQTVLSMTAIFPTIQASAWQHYKMSHPSYADDTQIYMDSFSADPSPVNKLVNCMNSVNYMLSRLFSFTVVIDSRQTLNNCIID